METLKISGMRFVPRSDGGISKAEIIVNSSIDGTRMNFSVFLVPNSDPDRYTCELTPPPKTL
jgi:hypothetical protein